MLQFIDRCGLEYNAITPSILEKSFILENCMDAIVNEEADYRIVTTATTYTHSIIYEFLEHAKEMLLKMAQAVLTALNNFYLNNVKIMEKYEDIICDNIRKLDKPIRQETYEYPVTKNYPVDLKSTIGAENDILRLHDKIRTEDISQDQLAGEVDRLLMAFGKEVLGARPDPYNLKDSVDQIVCGAVRGKEKTITITTSTFREYMKEITNYKKDRDDILHTKKAVLDDYNALKRTYSKVTKDPEAMLQSKIQNLKDPNRQAFIAHEYSRYADIHVEMLRLFNGYIMIYQTAFDTKLRCLSEKIDTNKAVINEIITHTGLFTSLNTKNTKLDKPIPRNIAEK